MRLGEGRRADASSRSTPAARSPTSSSRTSERPPLLQARRRRPPTRSRVCSTCFAAAPPTSGSSLARAPRPRRPVRPRHDARDQRDPDRHHRADGAALHDEGHPDILLLPRGRRADEPCSTTRRSTRSRTCRARSPSRSRSGSVADGTDRDAARRGRGASTIARGCGELEVEAVAVCLLWSIVNPAHELRVGELLAEHLPGVPFTLSHELNPSAARVPARLVDRHRRVAQAADEPLSSRELERAAARGGLRRPAADGDVGRRRARRDDGRRGADPLDQLRAGDGAGRRPPLRAPRRRHRHRDRRPTPAARATTSAWSGAARSRGRARRWLGAPRLRAHDRLPVGRRAGASARAAARSPGSTTAACCTSARRAPARARARLLRARRHRSRR